ncbi:substrate-binding periplasmic protein [Aliagarivorans marinus]|uniref:substrate-binding periplasmic protein n=1 Tax=Aliagarivorans marinus TaxID=561965 RepID=UPI000A03B0E9|nr:transporter substrate-binding domain-containing protein [Aliagarivorans marinus]
MAPWCYLATLTLLLSLSPLSKPLAACLSPLSFYTEDYAPINYMENGELKGAAVDSLRLIWQQLEQEQQPIKVVPWARGYRLVQQQPGTVLFAMSKTPGRSELFKWVGPLFTLDLRLLSRSDFTSDIDSLSQIKHLSIAVLRDDISEQLLFEADYPLEKMQRVKSYDAAYRLLQAGRVDFMIISNKGLHALQQRLGEPAQNITSVLTIDRLGNYLAFHRDTPDSQIECYQQALEAVREQQRLLVEQYGLNVP